MALAEHGVAVSLVEERPWERRRDFLLLNPAGTLPVLVDEENNAVCGAGVIAEFLDEIVGRRLGHHRFLPTDPVARAEVRRLVAWFDATFSTEVGDALVREKVFKRFIPRDVGGGAPDGTAIRVGRANIGIHLAYVDHLARNRTWLAGERLTFADLAAAAHLSCVDYLGDVPWQDAEAAKVWYARVKSRPSFRPFLAETVTGIRPAAHYADLDF